MPRRRTRTLPCALMHPIRAILDKRIHAAGTTSLDDLAEASGHNLAVVGYHVDVLVALGLAQTEKSGAVSATA